LYQTANTSIQVYGLFGAPERLRKKIEEIKNGFNLGLKPELMEYGTAGTYFLKD